MTLIATAVAPVLARVAGLPLVRFPNPLTLGLDVVAWAFVHASTGYLVHRLPLRCFTTDRALWRQRAWERNGATYSKMLRIARWQGRLPEAGAIFAGGFDKSRMRGRSTPFLERYVAETRRAELGHLLAILPAPLFALWNPAPIVPILVLYAFVANGPCMLSMRYNRLRLTRVLDRRIARQGRSAG